MDGASSLQKLLGNLTCASTSRRDPLEIQTQILFNSFQGWVEQAIIQINHPFIQSCMSVETLPVLQVTRTSSEGLTRNGSGSGSRTSSVASLANMGGPVESPARGSSRSVVSASSGSRSAISGEI